MQPVPESPQSHVCEVLQYLYVLEAHLEAPGPSIPPDTQALELVAGAKGRAWRALEMLCAARQAGQGAQPIAPWWYRVRRIARRAAVALFLCVLAAPLAGQDSVPAIVNPYLSTALHISPGLVTDTLAALAGVPASVDTLAWSQRQNGARRVMGMYRPIGDSVLVNPRNADYDMNGGAWTFTAEGNLCHEFGHRFRAVRARTIPDSLLALDPERFADRFARAVLALRYGDRTKLAAFFDVGKR